MPRLDADRVRRPLRLVPALAQRQRERAMLVRLLPGARRLRIVPVALDQPAPRIVRAPREPVDAVPVETLRDPLLQRVIPREERLLFAFLDEHLEDEADAQIPPSALITMPETNAERSLARKS